MNFYDFKKGLAMMDDGGGGGGPTNFTTYEDPYSGLSPEKAKPRDFDEREDDETNNLRARRGARQNLRIPTYGNNSGPNSSN